MPRKPVQDFFLFLVGGALFAAGIFLFTNQVMVNSGFRAFVWGGRGYGGGFGSLFGGLVSFGSGQGIGLLMIPFGIGVALLLADVQRRLGWFLVWAACAALGAAVLQSLIFSFRTTSLWGLLSMVVMIAGGGGLMFRSLRDYEMDDKAAAAKTAAADQQAIKELREEIETLKSQINRSK